MATRDKKRLSTNAEIARYYLDMIVVYNNTGINNTTKEGTLVTKSLIKTCEERFLVHAIRAHRREINEQ